MVYGSGRFHVYSRQRQVQSVLADQSQPGPDPQLRERDGRRDNGRSATAAHQANFYAAIRANDPKLLRGEIEDVFESCALCLLANISYRVGRKLEIDPATERFKDSDDNALLAHPYRQPYTIPEKI